MEFGKVFEWLKDADGFDLYRMSCAIDRMLEDPKKVNPIRSKFRVGDTIEYFDRHTNRLIPARILELNRSTVSIEHLTDFKRYRIPCYTINHKNISVDINADSDIGLSRHDLKVGDQVGFRSTRDNLDRYGKIIRLNPKTVTLDCGNQQWRVAYELLFNVVQGDLAEKQEAITVVDAEPEMQLCAFHQHQQQQGLSMTPAPHTNATNDLANLKKKVGRNDPCICGSGKKFKKCCG